jgi:hypothetical protein
VESLTTLIDVGYPGGTTLIGRIHLEDGTYSGEAHLEVLLRLIGPPSEKILRPEGVLAALVANSTYFQGAPAIAMLTCNRGCDRGNCTATAALRSSEYNHQDHWRREDTVPGICEEDVNMASGRARYCRGPIAGSFPRRRCIPMTGSAR